MRLDTSDASPPPQKPAAPGDWLVSLEELVAEEGDVAPMRRRNTFLLSHPDAVRDVLVTHDRCFRKSASLRWARWTLGNGLLTSEGEFNRKQRALISPSLHTKRLAGYADTMVRCAAEATDGWRDGEISAHREMMRLTLSIVAEVLFGAAVGPEVDRISEAMDLNVRMFRRVVRPWGLLRAILPTPFNLRYLFARRRVVGTLRRFIDRRRASGEQRDDLLSRLLAAKAMSEAQLIDERVTLFAAGHETTANALTFTLWLLSRHPDVERKLWEEVDAVLDGGRLPTFDDVERLPYARQVIAESMRLYPPAWIQGREATEPCDVDGRRIERGTGIFVSQWIIHRDPRWWPDPLRFDPDRFAEPQANSRPKWAYFPFGGGSRACVGEAFAWTEAVLVLATIARKWRLESVAPGEPELEPGITLRPKDEIRMVVRGRR